MSDPRDEAAEAYMSGAWTPDAPSQEAKLIARLRDLSIRSANLVFDRIEALSAENERLKAEAAAFREWTDPNSGVTYDAPKLAWLLEGRDKFIVDHDLWGKFVTSLDKYGANRAALEQTNAPVADSPPIR